MGPQDPHAPKYSVKETNMLAEHRPWDFMVTKSVKHIVSSCCLALTLLRLNLARTYLSVASSNLPKHVHMCKIPWNSKSSDRRLFSFVHLFENVLPPKGWQTKTSNILKILKCSGLIDAEHQRPVCGVCRFDATKTFHIAFKNIPDLSCRAPVPESKVSGARDRPKGF